MTAKERLRRTVTGLSEAEAAETLDFIARRRAPTLGDLLDQAAVEDEAVSDEEERAVQEAREQIERGETVPLEQVRSELR